MLRSVSISYRPLTQWPAGRARTPEHAREDARFKSAGRFEKVSYATDSPSRWVAGKPISLERTLDDLDRELWHIGVREAVVQLDVPSEREIRRDGQPRADARMVTPAIVVTFTRNRVTHVFACDRFKRWQDNLRGIVLGLEGLRRLERYGIVQAGEQYRGWQALPASTTPALSTEAAADVIARRSGWFAAGLMADPALARDAVRLARAKAHPDAGGSTADFQLVTEAARILAAHHGVPTL